MPVKGLRRNDAATCTTAGILIFFQCPMTTAGKPKKEMFYLEHGTQKKVCDSFIHRKRITLRVQYFLKMKSGNFAAVGFIVNHTT